MKHVSRIVVASGVALAGLGALLVWRIESGTSHTALADAPKGVTLIEAKPASYRASRRYVGAVRPWLEARIGPQFVAAFVDDVLVRPGDPVEKGALLARLACRHVAANAQALSESAKAQAAQQQAAAGESKRLAEMVKLGFVSQNEAEKKLAESEAERGRMLSAQAKTLSGALEQNDCFLRAPFAGEISERFVDPGAFVRPGSALLTLVDRSKVRVVADAPETEFGLVEPGAATKIHLLATGQEIDGTIARRAPAADAGTRTIRFEIDLANGTHLLPTGTSAELWLEVGDARSALEVPLAAATVRGNKATVFVIEGDVARSKSLRLLGEKKGNLFLEASLPAATKVVLEGRSTLRDGDRVRGAADPFAQQSLHP
jgi:RND family efflux transporter MFP subunit